MMAAVLAGLAGCKTEKSPDQPTIIGVPPSTAYLGVEYYYNFGAYGGDRILDFSLTNAPAWAGLEDTANKARPGVILRGVPGVTGGGRGAADLGNNRDINLTTTDGRRLGVQPFDIEVKENKLTLSAEKFREGVASDLIDGAGKGEKCEMPDMAGRGRHAVTYDTFAEDGSGGGTATETLDTYPVIVKVLLDQPSVQTSKIAFELRSEYDPSACDSGSPPNQGCEYSKRNIDEAQLGKDVVLAGNMNGDEKLPQPDYIEVTSETSGVITLKRGITECYIRLEVVDDKFNESNESFDIALTEVRQGLVSLASDGDPVTRALSIADNSPTVSFESLEGHNASAMNEGDEEDDRRVFLAVLDRGDAPLDEVFKARLFNDLEKASAESADFEFLIPNDDPDAMPDDPDYVPGQDIVFGKNVTTVKFQVHAYDDSGAPPTSENPTGDGPDNDDEFLNITVDQTYQYGRPSYAAKGTDLKLWLNELKTPLVVGDAAMDLIPTDMVVGDNGRIFVASSFKDGAARYARIEIFNRFGVSPPEQTIQVPTNGTIDPNPRVAFTERTTEAGSEERVVRGLGLVFQTNGAINGGSHKGGVDSAVYYYRRDSGDPEYSEVWHAQYGTAGDDTPLEIGLNSSDDVFVAGETGGTWAGESRGGGKDVYLQRIDTVTKDTIQSAKLAWTSQQGSNADEELFGLGVRSLTGYLVGTTRGQISDETAFGGSDIFLSNYAGSKTAPPEILQSGTTSDDTLADAYVDASAIWALGNGTIGYNRSIDEDEYEAFLEVGGSSATQQGHLLVYTLSGEFNSAINLNDPGDNSDETFTGLTPFDGDFIVGGQTSGSGEFVTDSSPGGLILARIERNQEIILEEDDEATADDDVKKEPIEHAFNKLEEVGRHQYPLLGSSAQLIKLSAYENAEITALISHDDGSGRVYEIMILNGDGAWLNE